MAEGPVLAPSVSVLEKGTNRFAFALFDRARKPVTGAQVAIYTSKTDGTGLRGPFPARTESLEVRPQFQSRRTASDPDAAKTIYVADLKLRDRGKLAILALVRSARPGAETGDIGKLIAWGPSPRASQALMLVSRARALLDGRLSPSIDDVLAMAEPILKHRMALTFAARAEGQDLGAIIARLVAAVE